MKWLSMAWIPRSWKNGLILYDLVCLRKKSQLLTGLFPFLPHCLGRQESNITLFFLMRKSVYQSLHPWPPNDAFTHATMEIIGRLVHSFLLNGSDTTPICTILPRYVQKSLWHVCGLKPRCDTGCLKVSSLILHTIEKCKTLYSKIHAIFSVPVDVASGYVKSNSCMHL